MALHKGIHAVGKGKQPNASIDFDFFGDDDDDVSPPKPVQGSQSPTQRVKMRPNRSASSQGGSESDTERNVVRIEAKVPQVERTSDIYGDSFESDGEETGRRSKPPIAVNSIEPTTENFMDDSDVDNSARVINGNGSKNNGSTKSKHDDARKYTHESDDSFGSVTDSDSYASDSDSDITDVSPLNSPTTPKGRLKTNGFGDGVGGKPPSRPKSGRSSGNSSARSTYEQLLQPNRDTMNLKLLMQAISEMEGKFTEKTSKKAHPTRNNFVGPSAERKNFSFRNGQVNDIDKENQRLMQKIMGHATAAKKQKAMKKTLPESRKPTKATTSSVNRLKEQKRIEQENLAMLRRLETSKPTTTLQRDRLITGFESHTLHGVPMAEMHPLPKHKTKPNSPYKTPVTPDFDLSFNSSTSSLASARQRPQSAKPASRPGSAKKHVRPQSAKAGGNTGHVRPPSAKLGRPNSADRSRPSSAKSQQDNRPAWVE